MKLEAESWAQILSLSLSNSPIVKYDFILRTENHFAQNKASGSRMIALHRASSECDGKRNKWKRGGQRSSEWPIGAGGKGTHLLLLLLLLELELQLELRAHLPLELELVRLLLLFVGVAGILLLWACSCDSSRLFVICRWSLVFGTGIRVSLSIRENFT